MNTKFLKMKKIFGKKNYWATKGLALLVLVMMGGRVRGQVSITSLPQTYTQDFDAVLGTTAITTWTNNTTVVGWYITTAGLPINTGSTNSNSCYNFGNTGTNTNTDRALGAVSSSTSHRFGLRLKNNSSSSITSFNISFTGEQWRSFNSGLLTFDYQIGSTVTSITSGTFTTATAFDFTSLQTSSGTTLDGNASANRTSISGTLTVTVAAGSEIMFRWNRATSSSPGLGIDDLSITAISTNNWTGATSTSWNTTSNWSLGTVPLSTDNITISSGAPVIDIDYTLASGRTLTISGTGSLTINPTQTLTIAGTADFGGKSVTLKSDATGTAAIGQITGTLSNASNLTVERYIPALRKFRFLASPVVGATAANWRNNGTNTAGIGTQITGGTTLNNFDQSTTNAASAFWYNEVNAGSDVTVGSGATSDPGWTAFANGNTEALTNGKGFRILVRGDRTISLDGTGSVTPTNTTLSVTGTYPGASVSIATTKTNSNTNSGFNLVGNPYPATIDWNTVTKGADISATYTTYNPNTGAFVAWNGTTGDASRYIASSQAFFVQQTGTTGGITIAEANKATNAAGNYFRNKLTDHLKLSMIYDSANYDAAFIHFRVDAQNDFDNYDGLKFQNAGVNIASVGTDGKRYNINSLASLSQTTEIPISILGSVLANYELKFEDVQSFKNHELYLIDTYLNKMLLLSEGFSYPIALSSDSASVKDGRLKIVFVQKTTGINPNEKNANAFLLYPNPASDAIHLLLDAKITNIENVAFEICNQLGAIIQFGNLDFTNAKDQSINIETLAQGIYFIKLQSNAQQQIIKFIK